MRKENNNINKKILFNFCSKYFSMLLLITKIFEWVDSNESYILCIFLKRIFTACHKRCIRFQYLTGNKLISKGVAYFIL